MAEDACNKRTHQLVKGQLAIGMGAQLNFQWGSQDRETVQCLAFPTSLTITFGAGMRGANSLVREKWLHGWWAVFCWAMAESHI